MPQEARSNRGTTRTVVHRGQAAPASAAGFDGVGLEEDAPEDPFEVSVEDPFEDPFEVSLDDPLEAEPAVAADDDLESDRLSVR